MKRFSAIILSLCMLLAFLPATVFSAEEISTLTITVSGFEAGANRDDVRFAVSDERIEISNCSVNGHADSGDALGELKSYSLMVTLKIKNGKDAKFADSITKDSIKIAGSDKTASGKLLTNNKTMIVTFSQTVGKSQETIKKEEEAEAKKHKHCYCGGYIENVGDHTSHEAVTYNKWNGENKISYTNGVAYVYLENDVVMDSTLNVGGGKTLYLCLNGHALAIRYKDHRVININVGGKLILCNCTRSEGGKITNGGEEYGAGIHNNGTVKMFGGVITKNEGGYGGGVYNNANFYLYGGDIYDNKALYGGGVWNDNDSEYNFIMYEGMIHMNVCSAGGGIWNNDNANLILKGGVITLNAAAYGGGVWNNGGNVTLDGGNILENNGSDGGGIWNNGGGVLEIKSGNISKNTATSDPRYDPDGKGAGIWNNGTGLILMSGGEITFNQAAAGGGVWCCDGSEFVMSGGVIAENEAIDGAGIYVDRSSQYVTPAAFRLSNKGGILMNYASGAGGGALVKGELYMEGDVDIALNLSAYEDKNDIFVVEGGKVTEGNPLPTKFIDVPADAYYLDAVKWAIDKGITSGTTEKTFSPDDECTRGQIITFLYRACGSPETDGFYFADTNPSDYFYDATRWAWELKMERTNAFSPNHGCGRYYAIKYIWYAMGKPESKRRLPFTDVADDLEYKEAISWALETGVTSGTTPLTFEPFKTCTRAQIVTFLYRAFNNK